MRQACLNGVGEKMLLKAFIAELRVRKTRSVGENGPEWDDSPRPPQSMDTSYSTLRAASLSSHGVAALDLLEMMPEPTLSPA